MAWCEVNVGRFPPSASSLVVEYREDEGARTYVRLGETRDARSRWQVPEPCRIRVRFRDARGRLWEPQEARFPQEVSVGVVDRQAASGLVLPTPAVRQEGPAVTVSTTAPPGEDPEEWEAEVVQTTVGGIVKDGVHLGYAPIGVDVHGFTWNAGQDLAVRGVRSEDGTFTDWITVSLPSTAPAVAQGVGHSNDFASGTIAKAGDSTGPAPLEINSGDLRHAAIYIGDADGYAGDCDIFIGDAGLYWGPATYTGANVTLDAVEDLQFQFEPAMTSITRLTRYIGDAHDFIGGGPRVDIDGTIRDPRPERLNQTNGDEIPMSVTYQVATSATASATFTDGDFAAVVPGKVYPNVREYAPRWILRTFRDTRLVWDFLYCRHWRFCRSRPWHSHSSAFELVYEDTLGVAAISSDATVTGALYDELIVEVLWTNAVAATVVLWARPNADATAGNYVDSSGAESKIILGPGIAQNAKQHAIFHLYPATGAVRRVIVHDAHSWTATTAAAPSGGNSWIWKDTSTAVTSVRILTDNGGSALASGTIIRVYGKQDHEA